MKNLDQIRAMHALKAAEDNVISGKKGGELVKKLPARITNNGLLAALSFTFEQFNKKEPKDLKEEARGHQRLFTVVTDHLRKQGLVKETEPRKVLEELAAMPALRLRMATSEVQAYLGFLRRYAQKETDELWS